MKKKGGGIIWWILPVFLIIIIIILGFYIYKKISSEKNYIGRDYLMEEEFKKILDNETIRQKAKGINVSVKEIEVFNIEGASKGFIYLNCEGGAGSEIENKVFEDISTMLIEKYPEKYKNESSFSWVDIECKF
jgi:hypothetical protein